MLGRPWPPVAETESILREGLGVRLLECTGECDLDLDRERPFLLAYGLLLLLLLFDRIPFMRPEDELEAHSLGGANP